MPKKDAAQPPIEYDIAPGKVIEVLGSKIQIEKSSGDGAVVDTYLGKIGEKKIIIRKLRNDISSIPLEGDRTKLSEAFNDEIIILSKLNQAEGISFEGDKTLLDRLAKIEATV